MSTCRFDFPGLIFVPSAHTQSGWGWLQKLKSMVLSGAEYSMAVMVAFPLSLVAILSSGPFSINVDILGFFQNCSYTVLALSFRRATGMPRTESFSAMSQDYLDFYYMSLAISLLGSGLGPQKMGQGHKLLGPTIFIITIKIYSCNNIDFVFYCSKNHLLVDWIFWIWTTLMGKK